MAFTVADKIRVVHSDDVELNAGPSWAAIWVNESGDLKINVAGTVSTVGSGGGGSGDVTAAANFNTDNRIIRSNGTSKGVQASAVTIDDSGNITGVAGAGLVSVRVANAGLLLEDTNASDTLAIVPGSNLTASRVLTIVTGDADRTLTLSGSFTGSGTATGTNTGDQNLFGSVIVSGQTTVTAASNPTALTLVAGSGVTITTDNTTKTITLTAAGGGTGDVSATSAFGVDNVLVKSDGTVKDVQPTGIVVSDSNAITGVLSIDAPIVGLVSAPTRLRTDLTTPGSLGNGDWWVEASGTTPTRVLAVKVRDGGVTYTIASITV